MKWTRLDQLPEREWHSPETAAVRDDLNERIREVVDNRGHAEKASSRALSTPLEDVDPDAVFASDIPHSVVFGLLQRELKLRRELPAYFDAEDVDRDAEYQAAVSDRERLEKELRTGLVKLGYHDVAPTSGVLGYIQPVMIFRNPIIMQADERVRHLRELRTEGQRRANDTAIGELVDRMEELRSRARSVV